LKRAVVEGEEINLFLKDPLIVGEVTSYIETVNEVEKLIRKADIVKKRYGRKPRKILVALTVRSGILRDIRRMCMEKDIELMVGKAWNRDFHQVLYGNLFVESS